MCSQPHEVEKCNYYFNLSNNRGNHVQYNLQNGILQADIYTMEATLHNAVLCLSNYELSPDNCFPYF